ncbi:hypothetical protein CYJ41_00170 [Campylobacter ureolyticus]|uniref:Uncharacterized protein n=1 Tax=Campylobacter ureolyticus TaxID=827 RepID=A0A2I1NBW8_9BACT|nr:hypothetical protein [Campylobacter ureolyticus]PKZ29893.1 hypothetical protein CYJ41_00170 [Campylobacter ureolyticus]
MKKIVLIAVLVFSFCFGSENKCSQENRLLYAITLGNCKVAKEIINKNPKIISEINEANINALETLFVYYYNLALFDLWQEYDFNCFLDAFLKEKPNLNFYIQEANMTPLGIIANLPIKKDKIEILDKLLKAGADLKQMPVKDSNMEILYFSLYYKNLNLMEYLLKNGATIEDGFGRMIAEWLFEYKTENQTNDEIMKVVKSKEFMRDRKWALKGVDIFLKYIDIKDFSDKDRLGSINPLTYFNDIEFVKKLVNLGIFDDKKELLEKAINYAKENRRFEIAVILENLKAKKGF